MKGNKLRLVIYAVIAIIVIVAVIFIFRKKYTLVINDADNIVSVVSQKNTSGGKIEVSSKTLIKEIIVALTSERTTKTKSKSDIPECEEYYIVTFKDTEQKLYIYTKDGNYYIEEPQNGIYKITQEEYDKIMQYLYF